MTTDPCFLAPACGCGNRCFARQACAEARQIREGQLPTQPRDAEGESVQSTLGVLGFALILGFALAMTMEAHR